ncbi:Serine/threonine-protein phosphatase 4 regulatory subunit 3 [Cryptosporidium felis]|nr:Serine/threonine-protein phosphatase 4 regulatory subunit 3 [Cryptosporidium felis]
MVLQKLNSIVDNTISENKAHCFNTWPLEYRRVKLYEVNPENGNWIDCGTGFISIIKEKNNFNILVLSDEQLTHDKEIQLEDKKIECLLEHENYETDKLVNTPIQLNREYCHQKESIITWQDGINIELYRALSFQHSESCNSLWSIISTIVPHLCVDLIEGELSDDQTGFIILDKPTNDNIDRIIDELELDSNIINSENIILDILSREFLDSLFALMEEFEQKSDIVGLHKIFQIIRRIIILYSHYNEVFETLLSDKYYLKFFKACEYDESLENYKIKFSHRKFLEKVKFHSVVPLPEVQTIHLNYRLMYLRDVVMPRHLDEQSLQRIANMINNNFSSIISMIVTTSDIWKYLKDNIQDNFLVAKFIHAVITVLKQNPMLSIYERHQIFIHLRANNILNEFYGYLNEDCPGAKHMLELESSNNTNCTSKDEFQMVYLHYSNITPIDLALEVYSMICEISPGLLRHAIQESSYINSNKDSKINIPNKEQCIEDEGSQSDVIKIKPLEVSAGKKCCPSLWMILCHIFFTSNSESTQIQICTIFKRILDPKTMDVPERDDSLSLFYDMGVLDILIDKLLNNPNINVEIGSLYSARVLFCDILSTCVQEHNYRIKYKILQNQLPRKLLSIAIHPFHRIFSISVIKFLRTCLGTRDDFYYRLFTKYDIFRHIFLLISYLRIPRNRGEGCILESVIIEMLDFICRNNIQILLRFMQENHIVVIRKLNYNASKGSKCRVFARLLESFNSTLKVKDSLTNDEKSCRVNLSSPLNPEENLSTDQNEKCSRKSEGSNQNRHYDHILNRGTDGSINLELEAMENNNGTGTSKILNYIEGSSKKSENVALNEENVSNT